MAEGFPGDPGHEGGSKPMMGLKGTCSEVHTQEPMQGENQENARGQSPDPWPGWDSTSLNYGTGGSKGISGNDSRTKST
jgi:hypothetical protein